MAAPRSELVERDGLGADLRRLEARRGRIRGPEPGVRAQPALGVAATELEQAPDEHLVEEDERQQLAARGRLAPPEQRGERREARRAQAAQAAVALAEHGLRERPDLAPPRRCDERVG